MKFPSGSIVGVFGLPCTGKTSVIQTLTQSSREILACISSGDIARRLSTEADTQHMAAGNLYPHEDKLRSEIFDLIKKRRASGAELIFLDGFPRTADQIQWLMANQLAGTTNEGCIVQVVAFDVVNRALKRMRSDQDTAEAIKKKIHTQSEEINKMDKLMHEMSIPYYTIINNDLTTAALRLTHLMGLKK